jgi:uncharacterized zinc-type alcohol dehydrogenase-like protein
VATKLAIAMGAEVTVITSSSEKIADAKALGAKNVINSTDEEDLKKNESSLHFILSTIPQPHDANPYISLLKRDGILTVVGCIAPLTKSIDLSKMIPDRKSLSTSLIGGIAETQELLDFCSEHNIVANVKIIPIDQINEVFAKVDDGEVDFRYVIDMVSIRGKEPEKSLLDILIS